MKMQQIVLLIAPWILNRNIANAQTLFNTYTPVHILGANFSEQFNTPLNNTINPSTAPYIKGFAVATLAEKKYLLDLNALIVSTGFGFQNNGINISLQHFGNKDYAERTLGAGFGKNLGKLNIGATVKYSSVSIAGLATTHFIQSTVASVIKVTENVSACVVLNNPNFFILRPTEDVRPASGFSLGFGWQVSPLVYTGIEYIKYEQQPMSVVVNIHYEFANDLSAMINWSTASNQPYLNIGWTFHALKFGAGCSYHSSLGISPTITLLYQRSVDDKK